MGAHTNINSNVTIRINKGIAKSRAIFNNVHAQVHTLSHSKVDSNVTIHPVSSGYPNPTRYPVFHLLPDPTD